MEVAVPPPPPLAEFEGEEFEADATGCGNRGVRVDTGAGAGADVRAPPTDGDEGRPAAVAGGGTLVAWLGSAVSGGSVWSGGSEEDNMDIGKVLLVR